MIKFLILANLFQLHAFYTIQIIKKFRLYNECAYHLPRTFTKSVLDVQIAL